MHVMFSERATCMLISFSLSQKASNVHNPVAKSNLEDINSLIMLIALMNDLIEHRWDDITNGKEEFSHLKISDVSVDVRSETNSPRHSESVYCLTNLCVCAVRS